ncbi:glycosyltransferase [uncultured Bacteroides sp.]|uniref:glycosyltransferase family 2 protein n=1 Tax=uncultured Bacteroides sp. TaxID=162156 RepID=UPI002AA78151|nr:glycosyltransferase [uncultured Bacteroides sp.]
MNKSRLAIVIPAYKSTYFDQALNSIAEQSCHDFTLYIGDDNSSDNLESIVDKYVGRINIVYKRFDSNLGGKDLVAQWERCVDMVNEEDWVWLFSDDDTMDENCVFEFYNSLKETGACYDLYHFNVDVINSESRIISNSANFDYPKILSCIDFYKKRLNGSLPCYVVEYVFRKQAFLNVERFQSFDLAWGSDVATWAKLSYSKGIYTIPKGRVKWRYSNVNISPNISKIVLKRKINTVAEMLNWFKVFFKDRGINVSLFNFKMLLVRLSFFSLYLNNVILINVFDKYFELNKGYKFYRFPLLFFVFTYLSSYKIYKLITK